MRDTQVEQAFLEAHRAYADALFRHAAFRISNRERSVELVQDAFLKAWDFAAGGGEVQEYKSFFYRILNNLIIDEYRKKKSSSLDEILENDTGDMEKKLSEGSARETEEKIDERVAIESIRARIPDLPDMYREVITLRYVDDFSPKEIADMCGLSQNTVSVRLHRGVQKLRELCLSHGKASI